MSATYSLSILHLGLEIPVDNANLGAKQVLASVRPQWNQDDINFKHFTDGYSNHMVGCYLSGDASWRDMVLVRVNGRSTEGFTDRQVELAIMLMLQQVEFGAPIYCSFTNGICYGFTQGRPVTKTTVKEEHIGRLFARKLVQLHSLDPNVFNDQLGADVIQKIDRSQPSAFTLVQRFFDMMPIKMSNPDKEKWSCDNIPSHSELAAQVAVAKQICESSQSPVVFCHNDLMVNNIIYNSETDSCHFIDFEYAHFNFEAFELATFFCGWTGGPNDGINYPVFPNKETQCRWLRHFLEEKRAFIGGNPADVTEAYVEALYVEVNRFTLVSNLFIAFWDIVQAELGELPFNYHGSAKGRLDEYYRRRDEVLALPFPPKETKTSADL